MAKLLGYCTHLCPKNTFAGPDGKMGGNVILTITKADIITRPGWTPASEPPDVQPRLHGANAEWINKTLRPFFDADCTFHTATSPGWGWKEGFPDVKSSFEIQTLGYQPCFNNVKNAVPPVSYHEHQASLFYLFAVYWSQKSHHKMTLQI